MYTHLIGIYIIYLIILIFKDTRYSSTLHNLTEYLYYCQSEGGGGGGQGILPLLSSPPPPPPPDKTLICNIKKRQ